MFDIVGLVVFVVIFAVIGSLGLLVWLLFSDGDLTLMYYAKYGKKAGDVLPGHVAWITGASSGIGEYVAYELAKAGCKLVLSARRSEELERVKKQCIMSGKITADDVLCLPLDVRDLGSHAGAAQKVLDKFKQVDILVNNAGRSQRAWAINTSVEVDQQMFELNVLGQLSLTKAVLPHMVARKKGHIVVTSSIAGKIGVPFSATYSATKFALHGWFDALRTELYEDSIDVTVVCPGPVHSQVQTKAFTEHVDKEYGQGMAATDNRLTTTRCAELIVVAITNRISEAWMSPHPPLFLTYVMQYMPAVGKMLAGKMGVQTLKKMREGKI